MPEFGNADMYSMFRCISSLDNCCETSVRLNGNGADGDKPLFVQNLGKYLYNCAFGSMFKIKFALQQNIKSKNI